MQGNAVVALSVVRSIVFFLPRTYCSALALGAVACAAWAPAQASAETAPERVALKTAMESAWQRSVHARETQARLRHAEAEQRAATSLWAAPPATELSHRDDRGQDAAGRRESEIGLSWPLWLPGQQAARQEVAQAEQHLARVAERASKLRLAGEVRESAWRVQAHQAELAQADSQARTLQSLVVDVERRVQAGELARADAMAARAELLMATAWQVETRQRLADSRSRWKVLTGHAADPDPTETSPTSPAPPAADHPELLLAWQAVERSRKRLGLVGVATRAAPEITLRYRQDVGGAGQATQNSVGVSLRLPWRTADRNLPLEAAALGELDVAQTAAHRLQEQQAAESDAARAAVHAAGEQLAAERSRADLLRERAQLIEKSFQAGETPLPELLRALGAAAQAQAALARQQAALGLAQARYQQTLGLIP